MSDGPVYVTLSSFLIIGKLRKVMNTGRWPDSGPSQQRNESTGIRYGQVSVNEFCKKWNIVPNYFSAKNEICLPEN